MTGGVKNAYLIICPRPEAAELYVTRLLCDIYPEAEDRVRRGEHPDIFRVPLNPNGKYGIDTVRDEVLAFIAKRGYEGGYKTVVIAEAQRMNSEAGNALLKSLEEPPKNTVFVLSAPSAGVLLPTIVSRCECIRLLPESDAVDTVVAAGMDRQRAKLYCSLAGGYAQAAIALAGNEPWIEMRGRVLDICGKLAFAKRYVYAAHVEYLVSVKSDIDAALSVMESWFSDLATVAATGETAYVVNIDRTAELTEQKTCWTAASLCRIIDIVEQTRHNISGAAALELCCERMFITILEERLK